MERIGASFFCSRDVFRGQYSVQQCKASMSHTLCSFMPMYTQSMLSEFVVVMPETDSTSNNAELKHMSFCLHVNVRCCRFHTSLHPYSYIKYREQLPHILVVK